MGSVGDRICVHCLSTVPLGEWSQEEGKWFCCHGCRLAYKILNEAGLGSFYQNRDWREAGLPEGAYGPGPDEEELSRHVVRTSEGAEIVFLLDGVRCATCVWVIEKLLARRPGVREARASFSARTARISFDPDRIGPGEIAATISSIGYPCRPFEPDEREKMLLRERRSLLMRLGTAVFLSMQLMGASIGLYGGYLRGMEATAHEYLGWFSLFMATPVVFYCGYPFLSGAARAIRNRAPDMDLLVGLGVGFAYFYSVYALLIGAEVYFDSAAAVVTFLLLGRLVEAGARERSLAGIGRLMKLAPDRALLVVGEEAREVPSGSLKPGDLILVRPGDRFPADGRILEGSTEVDEAPVTGEPYPRARWAGDPVVSGTTNLGAAVKVVVTAAGAEAFIARVARLVAEAESGRLRLQRLADRAATVFVPVVVALAGFAFLLGYLQDARVGTALLRAVAVMVVACPCALGLATPLAVMAASGSAAGRGIIFRGGEVMESLATVTTAAFDKTGTLTLGRPRVSRVEVFQGDEREVMELASMVEGGSSHPIARGVREKALSMGIAVPASTGLARPGLGMALTSPRGVIRVGSQAFLEESGIRCPPRDDEEGVGAEAWVALDGNCLGRILLEDALKPESASTVAELEKLGVEPLMLTGDRPARAGRVAKEVGIHKVEAGLTPEGKAAFVKALAEKGERVVMVGDGINDAGALAAATVGCSMGGGSDVALDTAGLVLLRPNLGGLTEAIKISRLTLKVIRQNLVWAFGYNGVALILAVLGYLAPLHAAIAMAGSSVTVTLNSLRLTYRRKS